MACCRSDDAVREATTPSIWWRAVEASVAADAAASEEGKNLTDDLYREAAASAHGVSLNLDKAKKCIDEINKLCETNKNKFFDPAFPCGTASLNRFSDRPAVRGSQDNTWSRATEANFAHQASSLNVDVTRCFHPQLATQVLALVGDKEDALYPAKFNRYGVYGVRVWAANSQEWRMVLVDDYLPSAVGSLLDSTRVALVLKALAKLHGSYQGIDAGAPLRCNIVNALTGWSPYDRITVAADVVRACREGLGATGLRLFTTVGLVAAEVTGTSDERGIQLKLPCVPNDANVAADGPILWLSDADVANRELFLDAYGVSSEALPGPLFVLTPKADLWSVALVEPDPPRLVHVLTEKTTCPRTIDGGSELATAPQWAITVSETTHVSLHATRGDANSIGAVFATGNNTTLKSGRVVDWLAAPIASSVNNEASPVVALAPGAYTIAVAVPTATHSPVTLKLQSDKALSWSLIPTPVVIRCRCAAAEDGGERVLRVTTASADAVEVLLDVYRQPVTLSTASPVKASIDVLTSRKSLRVMVSADKAAELREAVAVKQGLEVTAIVVGGSGQVEIRQA